MAFSRNDLKSIEGMTDAMIDGVMSLHQVSETAHRQAMDALQGEINTLRAGTPSAEVMTELESLRKWKTDREEADRVANEEKQWSDRFGKLTDREWSTDYNRRGILEEFKTAVGNNSGKSDAEIFADITKGREDALFVPKRQAFVNPPARDTATEAGSAEEYMRSNPKYKNNPWLKS